MEYRRDLREEKLGFNARVEVSFLALDEKEKISTLTETVRNDETFLQGRVDVEKTPVRFDSSVDCFPKLVPKLEEETAKTRSVESVELNGKRKAQASLFGIVLICLTDESVEEDLQIRD